MWLHQYDFQSAPAAGCRNEDLAAWRPSSPDDADGPLLESEGGGSEAGDEQL